MRLPFFLGLPRAARRAETGPSLALGYFDIAPSALKDDGINGQTPKALQATPLQVPRPSNRNRDALK